RPTRLLQGRPDLLRVRTVREHRVRSPAWMVAYAAVLVLLGAGYATVVYVGPRAALFFTVPAFVAALVSVYLTLRR
ncbi:MAG: hypothetical protein M3479_01320, partial [Actinomycetota bacterium]|nr:hypothetical protein [Actinomycetota bacterium]